MGNRRYLGSKSKLLGKIEESVSKALGRVPTTFMDPFSGSGVVSGHFAELGSSVVANDLLRHNTVTLETFLLHSSYDYPEACSAIVNLGKLKPIDGYITENFGGRYFSINNSRALDAAREFIDEEIASREVRNFALTSLLYAADKVAQTVGHYDAFFNRQPIDKPVIFKAPLPVGRGSGHLIENDDANIVVPRHSAEVLYLDPPYNSRQYSAAYHVLENIARWEKPKVHGVSMKMDRSEMKSKYSTRLANVAFKELVGEAKAELIVLSYSNTGNSRTARSNNVLSDTEILDSLSEVGEVSVITIDFSEFSVGRTSERDHQERLFVCRKWDA